jgi:hypothetical protein
MARRRAAGVSRPRPWISLRAFAVALTWLGGVKAGPGTMTMLRRNRRAAWLTAAALSLGDVGCGEKTGDDFTLTVVQADSSPVPGAAVAVDRADGSREEGLTGADGTFSASNVNGAGPFSFTVAALGFVAVSRLGATQGGPWSVTLSPLGQDPAMVDVAGVVRGKSDPNHQLVVSATTPSTRFDGTGPEYTLRVAPGQSVFVVSEQTWGPAPATPRGTTVDFTSWTQFMVDPTLPSELNLALPGADTVGATAGESLTPQTASGTLQVPLSMSGATGGLEVTNQDSGWRAFLGGAQSIAVLPNGTDLTYDAQYVTPVADLVTVYWLERAGAWSYARGTTPGDNPTFLDPPSLSSPQPLFGSLPVKGMQPNLATRVNILRDDLTTVWEVFPSAGMGITVPKLPSGIAASDVLGTGRIAAVPENCEVDTATGSCSRWALGAPADLVSP